LEEEIQSAYHEELQRLTETAAEIDRQLTILEGTPRYYGEDLTEQVLDNLREQRRQNLGVAAPEPYFGRMDFQEEGQLDPRPLYLGKVGIEDEQTGELLVIDWRAPVASMFYSFTGGDEPAAYESPEDGTIAGLIYLKRNLVIRKQILQRVVDAYTKGGDNLGVQDEFLLYRLTENKDNRLRDIVSTIQAEQDKIIRSARNAALVIQGVAGSGKTTVALHRLAYLLYQYRENVRAERMIIFAPNSMFLDYISGVLPELGVGGIQQTTFSDWALERLDQEVKLTDPADRLSEWFAIGDKRPALHDDVPGRYKGSTRFLALVDQFLDEYEKNFVPTEDYVAWDGTVLQAKQAQEWFDVDYQHYPLAKRRERIVGRVKRWLEMELDTVSDPNVRKKWKKDASAKMRTYLKKWPALSPFQLYRELYAHPELAEQIPAAVRERSLKLFKKKLVDLEDLAPLLHIRNRLWGIDGNDMFDHTVIDEAQDFSPYQVSVLKTQTRANSFSILGDLSQGIHAYQGVRDWQEFLSLFGADESAYFTLDRSYRSTMEIIHFANRILERSGENVTLARPVFRSGEEVTVTQVPPTERFAAIATAVRAMQTQGATTVAVIGRTEAACRDVQEQLLAAGLEASLIHAKQREYRGGLSVLPIYLCKGLEFDGVLLIDVDDIHYEDNMQDAKLLYVGCTRALHHLQVLVSGTPSPLLA